MTPEIEKMLNKVRESALVIDLETASFDKNRVEINIKTNFDDYVANAEVKWIGMYSYKTDEQMNFNVSDDRDTIIEIIKEHKILIGFNIEDFDYPILCNTGLIQDKEGFTLVDCMIILGKASFYTKKGFPFKNRGTLMDYDFSSNSMRVMAEEIGLETQKGEIDYRIFQQNTWNFKELEEINTYLTGDILVNKQMFDKLWSYWLPFTQFLPEKSILDLSWIKGSIASVIYKAACHLLGEEPTYADTTETLSEMGGRVIEPRVEEARSVFYVDFASLYPHLMTMFNLFSEIPEHIDGPYVWKGNSVFQVKGHYDISHPHPLAALVTDFLKKRIELKKTDPKNPMVYTYKIFLNGLYGVVRSKIFEKVHKQNAGWDTCSLGQQCQKLTEDMMLEFGFKTIAGDTDSLFLMAIDKKNDNKEYLMECIGKIVGKIKENAPFKVDTFNIALEHHIDYIMFPFEDAAIVGEDGKNVKVKNRLVKERKGKKKSYLYIYTDKTEKKVVIKGLPIKKNNATKLGFAIFNDVLEKKIIEKVSAKFPKAEIEELVNEYLKKPDAMDFISQEYCVKPFASYKLGTQIQAQISKGYFNGGDGTIRLIKNTKCGSAGKGTKYCSVQEALENKLTVEDLDLTKVWNELDPFIVSQLIGAKNESNT